MAAKRSKKPTAKSPAGTAKAWGGRFASDLAPLAAAFNASLPFDRRLWDVDLRGSEAHARMLGETGILKKAEVRAILGGLAKVRKEIEADTFPWREAFEDVHLNIEKRLIELVGPVGGKLHTARSRNDQVATDLRLYLRGRAAELDADLHALQAVLVDLADAHRDAVMPGYTHLQRAQPVLFAHHLLAYFEMFGRDRARFADCAARMNECPLGAGALAGTPFPIDRAMTARDLDFARPMANSMDAVASRDFALEFLAAAAIAATHLARFAEELILWSSAEWGFVEIDDAFATGSSIMPQKKNADMAELARGKAGRVVGALVSLLVTVKGLPLAYNKDLQEDKEPVFDAADTLHVGLRVFAGMLATLTVHPDRMLRATEHGYLTATDLADYLAAKGLPFREAHGVVGRLVARAIRRGVALHEIPLDEMREESDLIEADVYPALDVRRSVESRRSLGGTASREVTRQIRRARKRLARS